MEFIKFEQCNYYFGKPLDMTDEQCHGLNVFKGYYPDGSPVIISCARFSEGELETLQKTGVIWVHHAGDYLQPHSLHALSPFSDEVQLPPAVKGLTVGQIELLAAVLAKGLPDFPRPETLKFEFADGLPDYNGAYDFFKSFLTVLKDNFPE